MMPLKEFKDVCVRVYLLGVLREADWRVPKAATMAGVRRVDFYGLMKRHGIPTSEALAAVRAPRGRRIAVPLRQEIAWRTHALARLRRPRPGFRNHPREGNP